jgi:DNA-binding transcriptional regulator YhcF (GntR family)
VAIAPASRTGRVVRAIRTRIEARTLTQGARLPSIRAMAAAHGVACSTVVEAYERLGSEGVIRSRPGSGFYVAAPLAALVLDRLEKTVEREVDPLCVAAAPDLASC